MLAHLTLTTYAYLYWPMLPTALVTLNALVIQHPQIDVVVCKDVTLSNMHAYP
jgi:hypothetical protein